MVQLLSAHPAHVLSYLLMVGNVSLYYEVLLLLIVV